MHFLIDFPNETCHENLQLRAEYTLFAITDALVPLHGSNVLYRRRSCTKTQKKCLCVDSQEETCRKTSKWRAQYTLFTYVCMYLYIYIHMYVSVHLCMHETCRKTPKLRALYTLFAIIKRFKMFLLLQKRNEKKSSVLFDFLLL